MSDKETCKLCNKEYSKIATHLKRTHNIDVIDYYREYDRDRYLLKLQVKFLNDFYISYRRKYIKMNNNSKITSIDEMLNDSAIKQHLNQRSRVGIRFSKQGTDLIGLDIDTLDIDVLEKTYQTLIDYDIPSNNILITFSGNKGYHIDIFLSEYLDRKLVQAFYEIILHDTEYSTTQIELRGASDEGYFLPFSVNFKGLQNKNYGYCGIVNEYGIMTVDTESEINILESMQKLDADTIKDIVLINYKSIDIKSTQTIDDDIEQVESTLQTLKLLDIHNTSVNDVVVNIGLKTIIEQGTRHKLAFVYAIALREIGMSESDLYNQLILWHENLTEGYKSNWIEIEQDCKSITKSVFIKRLQGYKYKLPSNARAYITRDDIKQFISISNKADRRIYLALTVQSNMFRDYQGNFYMTYEQIKEMLSINTMNSSILKYIKRLEEYDYINIVSQNKRVKGQTKHEPNVYKVVGNEIEVAESDKYYLSSNNQINKLDIEKAIKDILTTREYKTLVKNNSNLENILSCLSA